MVPSGRTAYRCVIQMRNVHSLRLAMFSVALATLAPSSVAAQRACDERAAAAPASGWAPPLDAPVSLTVRDVSLREALDRLTAASGVQVAYSADFLPLDRRVCITAERQPLGALLTTLVRGTPMQLLVVAGRIVLSPGASPPPAADAMARSVSVLERVVVTGSAVAAPRRPLVIGLEVIDGEQMRRQSLGSLAELLNASVPGLWSWAQSPSAMVSQYGGIRGASSFGSSAPKIYIDGVEVANPLIVTQLNPDAVDHIEVIRGPQGSALYGSDAISGVINVLTRHHAGAYAPVMQLRSVAGAAGSQFASGLVPTHEQRLSVRLGSNVKSAGGSVLFAQTGALFPSSESRQLSAMADARMVTSTETLAMSLRVFDKRAGMGRNPLIGNLISVAPVDSVPGSGPGTASQASTELPQAVRQYTLSTSGTFATDGRWTHTVVAGVDGYSLNNVADVAGPFSTGVDSALRAARGNGDRVTFRESSVARFGTPGQSEGRLTLGIEYSVLRQATAAIIGQTPPSGTQRYPTAIEGLREAWTHNAGLISQGSMSWRESIFLTGGLRLERNDAFSGDNRHPLLPMVGLAVVRSVGAAEIKWRAAYGKGIRPPQTPARGAAMGYAGDLGYMGYAGNGGGNHILPALDPEEQAGYEGGVELYLGRALSFQLTRFDQRVTGLIQNVAVAVDTFAHGSSIQRRVRYQLQNVGEITNTGWEVQGSANHGAFSLATAFSTVDSRVRALANGYMGDLRPGDRMLAVPERTGSATLSWSGNQWYASLGATRAMNWINYDRLAIAQQYVNTSAPRSLTGAALRGFWRSYDGETHLRLNLTRDVTQALALLMTGENLLGGQVGEPDNVTIRPGRSITAGVRASF